MKDIIYMRWEGSGTPKSAVDSFTSKHTEETDYTHLTIDFYLGAFDKMPPLENTFKRYVVGTSST